MSSSQKRRLGKDLHNFNPSSFSILLHGMAQKLINENSKQIGQIQKGY